MEQQADYIRRIEIKGLWARFNIQWDLRPDVNILSGINGVGKTTILNRSVGYLEQLSGDLLQQVDIGFLGAGQFSRIEKGHDRFSWAMARIPKMPARSHHMANA